MKSRLTAALLLAGLAAFSLAVTASAHAELISSDPAAGGTLETTPYTLTATFDEELDAQASTIVVRDSSGAEVASGGVSEDYATVMTVELPELAPGEYTVRWTSVTPDDQGVERGTFTFTVAEGATPTAEPTGAPSAGPTPAVTASPIDGQPTGSGNDVLLALILAAIAIGVVVLFVFMRSRR